MIRVAIADDEALIRRGISLLLRSADDIDVVGEAADGPQAVAIVRRTRPDVVLMDIRMQGGDGLEATRRITGDPATAATRVLVLTTYDLDDYVFEALRSGASGFLLKDTPPDDLLEGVRIVHHGDALLAPSVTRRLIHEFTRPEFTPRPAPQWLSELTARELEVLVAVAHGHSNIEIGTRLHMSYATAKAYVSRLLSKLDVRDRAQLVMHAYEARRRQSGRNGRCR